MRSMTFEVLSESPDKILVSRVPHVCALKWGPYYIGIHL